MERLRHKYHNLLIKQGYSYLLNSGMFWEFFPELSGNYDTDKITIIDSFNQFLKDNNIDQHTYYSLQYKGSEEDADQYKWLRDSNFSDIYLSNEQTKNVYDEEYVIECFRLTMIELMSKPYPKSFSVQDRINIFMKHLKKYGK